MLDLAMTMQMCLAAIGEQSDRLGGVTVEVAPAGRLVNQANGDQLVRISVRIVYAGRRPEERRAVVWCVTHPSGAVSILPLDKRPPYALD